MENYIVFKNGVRVDIDQESTEYSLAVSFKNITEFADFVNELTSENLKRILAYAGDVVVAEYENRRIKQIKVEPGKKIKAEIELEKDDIFVLCSDGLTDHVEDVEIALKVCEYGLMDSVRILLDLALERCGKDNITILRVDVV